MEDLRSLPCTAFDGSRRLAAGSLEKVALAVKSAADGDAAGPLLVFADTTGRVIDLDLRGSPADVLARLAPRWPPTSEARGPGRPRLGVIAREVTLLPRHWEWLAAQPGGASVALRKLVEEARRNGGDRERIRAAQEAAYRFMAAMGGNLPGFEEAIRALFAGDRARFKQHVAQWPKDLRLHATRLAFGPTRQKR
ncbi:DUF2239 family protein [Desertibaculum subflavum]|uniref:DUF2239 family protein n=1 Tax=Desertibaculum subflavum TaxID=2268458 RepID=UPI0034D329AE